MEATTLKTYPKLVGNPGVRVARSQSSLLDFLADRGLERATGSGWGSMTGFHQRARINASLNTERNWS